jgi:hypothetical protein
MSSLSNDVGPRQALASNFPLGKRVGGHVKAQNTSLFERFD